MTEKRENWYRTGAAAKLLATSPYKIRELFRAGLIPSELRNGYRYISERELDRLKREGLPPMPASADLDSEEGQDGSHESDSSSRPARSRLTQELYAEPSRQLAKSKEKVIRLEHAAEAKRLRAQMREIDSAARDEQARARRAQEEQRWRDSHVRRAVESVPGEICSEVCEKVEALLNRVPPCADVAPKVSEIIEAALLPVRERERQARDFDEHRRRIVRAVQSFSLPYGATSDEAQEARELALTALEALPVGAADRHFRNVLDGAIRPIVERISQRRAEQEHARQAADYRRRVAEMVSWCWLFNTNATGPEKEEAKRRVRAALEMLPVTATHAEMSRAKDAALAPIESEIEQRREAQRRTEAAEFEARLQRMDARSRAESHLRHVETELQYLENKRLITFDGYLDRVNLRERLIQKIRPMLVEAVSENPSISNTEIRDRIREWVYEFHPEFCE